MLLLLQLLCLNGCLDLYSTTLQVPNVVPQAHSFSFVCLVMQLACSFIVNLMIMVYVVRKASVTKNFFFTYIIQHSTRFERNLGATVSNCPYMLVE